MLAALVTLALMAPPVPQDVCAHPSVRPGACPVPSSWVCLSPAMAAAERAAVEAAAERCRIEAERVAKIHAAELDALHRRGEAEADALRGKLAVAVEAAEERYSVWAVVGWTAGGVAVGALAAWIAFSGVR